MVFPLNLHLFFAVLLLFALQNPSIEAKGRKLKFCKLDTAIECFTGPVAFLTSQENGTGVPSNTVEYEQSCL